ncbi:MAG: immunoglobulin domain-containing protein, partial [Candidatus Kapaibacterium sp.]
YNNYWSTGGTLTVWNGFGNTTLANHRMMSGQDANSSNVDVTFVDQLNNDLSLTLVDVNLYGIGSTSNGTFNSGIRGIVGDDIFGGNRNRSEVFMGAHQLLPVISFNPAPPTTLNSCANQTLTISGNAQVTFGAQLSFSWQRNGAPLLDGVNGVSGASTGTLTIANASPSLNGGDYVLRVTATGGADPLVSNIINVVVNAPIEINAHPASRVICRGNETSMAVVADGTILGYQWQKDGRDIAGATGPIYVISNAAFDMSGRYRCVLSGTCGTTTLATNDAVVYVASNTLIGSNPETIGVAVGSTGYLNVEVNAAAQFPGYSPQFQWYNGQTMLSDNGRISGAATNQLTIRNIQSADINANYYCVVTGVCGSETSKQGGFYVSQISVTNQPANQEVCSGKDASLMVSASSNIPNVVYSYQWRLNGTAISTSDANYAGANTSSLTIKNAGSALAGDYTVLIKANPTGATILSDVATISVISAPVVGTQPQNVTVCNGERASMTVAATGGTLSYQWKVGAANIPGATGSTVEIASADLSLNGAKVTCVVSNNCGETTTSEAVLTVNDKPSITTGPSNTAVVIGSNFVLSVVATNATGYQWKKDGASIPGATTATYTLTSFTRAMAGKYSCDVTNSCGTVTSDAASLTVSGREEEAEAAGFALANAVPTPTFAASRIDFTMPQAQAARIVMHDAFGREVVVLFDGIASAGTTTIVADAAGLTSGVYTYTLTSGQHAITRRMVVTK